MRLQKIFKFVFFLKELLVATGHPSQSSQCSGPVTFFSFSPLFNGGTGVDMWVYPALQY